MAGLPRADRMYLSDRKAVYAKDNKSCVVGKTLGPARPSGGIQHRTERVGQGGLPNVGTQWVAWGRGNNVDENITRRVTETAKRKQLGGARQILGERVSGMGAEEESEDVWSIFF